MKFGAGLPLVAAEDTVALRDFVQALDGAGFDLLTAAGHVLSSPAGRWPDRPTPTYVGPFHDHFVLFSYLAAITSHIHFRPSILILPLFPTALVAKQAAELQTLSNGRFELGVGISWNTSEYHAMGQDFTNRGRRQAEQLEVLRRLWTEPYVTFNGRFHTLDQVGLNRLPSKPIPVWVGSGTSDVVLRRVARLADGWTPMGDPTEVMPRLRQFVEEAGRDPKSFGLTARIVVGEGGPAAWVESARKAQALGATYLTLSTPPDVTGDAVLKRLIEARAALATEVS